MEITIDRLFRAMTEVVMPNDDVVFVRALSDSERKSRSMSALAAAVRLEDKLLDESSEEYAVHILSLKRAERDELLSICEQWAITDAWQAAYKEVKDELIPFPDDATDEEKKAVIRKREKSEARTKEKREKLVEERVAKYRGEANKKEDEELRKEAITRRRMITAMIESQNEDYYVTVFLSTHKKVGDKFIKYFESLYEVKQLDATVMARLYDTQKEVDSLDPWAISKFRARRESTGLVGSGEAQPDEAGQ